MWFNSLICSAYLVHLTKLFRSKNAQWPIGEGQFIRSDSTVYYTTHSVMKGTVQKLSNHYSVRLLRTLGLKSAPSTMIFHLFLFCFVFFKTVYKRAT